MKEHHYQKERDYWLARFSGEWEKAFFPYDETPSAELERRKSNFTFCLPSELSARLEKLAGGYDTRLHIILMAAVMALLNRYSGHHDLIVGAPIYTQDSGRDFVNTVLGVRLEFGEFTFKELLMSLRRELRGAVEHQNYPLRTLLYQLDLPFSEGEFPLFDVVVLLENIHKKEYIHHLDHNLSFCFKKDDNGIGGYVEYVSPVYLESTIKRITRHLESLLNILTENVNAPVLEADFISDSEKTLILEDFNNTRTDYPSAKTIDQLFLAESARYPAEPALVLGDYVLSYAELEQHSAALALELSQRGVTPGMPVGIMDDRSIGGIVAVLAILRAGGAYVPIGTDYPEERKRYIIDDCRLTLILSSVPVSAEYDVPVLVIDVNEMQGQTFSPVAGRSSNDLAYIIYTSGSTGGPKGVMVTHRNVVRLVKSSNVPKDYVNFQPGSKLLSTAPLEFDASTFEVWGALLNGMCLHLMSREELLEPGIVQAYTAKQGIGLMWFTSPLFNRLADMDPAMFAGLEQLIVGGDVLSPPHISRVRRACPQLKIYNGYGPTENTTFSTTFLIRGDYHGVIPIGKPIANSTAFIFDAASRLCPIGVFGELYLGGDGLARGYLNNPELTAERFVPGILYRTGDIARWLPDGNIEFQGRADRQVKVRGFRVEPGEIETRILALNDVQEAYVMHRTGGDGEGYLCAYVVMNENVSSSGEASSNEGGIGELKQTLAQSLPDYMMPSFFVRLESLPLTANGKVDRRQLPEPDMDAGTEYAAPRDETENVLVDIYSQVLGMEKEQMGIDSGFFDLGGHSLKATVLISNIHKALDIKVPLAEIFQCPTIRQLAAYIRRRGQGQKEERFSAIQPVEEKEYYPLTSAQTRMMLSHRMDPTGMTYNIPMALTLEGEIDIETVNGIFLALIRRHEALRTSFCVVDNVFFQRIHAPGALEFSVKNGGNPDDMDIMNTMEQYIRPFDLTLPPLLRVNMFRSTERKHVLMLDIHHIIADGVSLDILIREFMALLMDRGLPALKVRYRDFARWRRDLQDSERMCRQEKYWLDRLKSSPRLNFPTDFKRPTQRSWRGGQEIIHLDKELTTHLEAVKKQTGVTMYMVLLAAYFILLHKYSGDRDIIIGSTVSGRGHADLDHMVGVAINMLAIRQFPAPDKSLSQFLQELKRDTLAANENQDYAFDDLVVKLGLQGGRSRHPLFDVAFALQPEIGSHFFLPGSGGQLKLSLNDLAAPVARFDMTLLAVEAEDRITLSLEYSRDLYKPESARAFLRYFKELLKQFESPAKTLADLYVTPPAELAPLLERFNNTEATFPREKTISQLFLDKVSQVPHAIALTGMEHVFNRTYKKTCDDAVVVADGLRRRGVMPGSVVAVKMPRSPELAVTLLGVLMAGAAYLPIPPDCPAERVQYMLEDSNAALLVEKSFLNQETGATAPPALESISSYDDVNSMAYIIYTSGSTGKPKGVVVEHVSAVNLLFDLQRRYPMEPGDAYLFKTSYSFDVSVSELFGWFMGGGRLAVPAPGLEKEPATMLDLIQHQRITHLNLVPSMFRVFLDTLTPETLKKTSSLKYLFLAGEALASDLVERALPLMPRLKLENLYGPTEATVYASGYPLNHWNGGPVPIGKPLSNIKIYILDPQHRFLPPYIPGELCIAGNGLARGYLNNPELTYKKFLGVQNPFYKKGFGPRRERLYRTGDLARFLPDGLIEFLGRIDHQVKIRGFRVEPGEIAGALIQHEGVKDAVVTALPGYNDDKALCAYVVRSKEVEVKGEESLREYLARKLPDYMVPAFFVFLQSLPFTSSGKIDRNALPIPGGSGHGPVYTAPRTPVEQRLRRMWADVLGIQAEKIGIDDNFFHLGGHSLTAAVLTNHLHRAFDVRMTLNQVFQAPTIRRLAQWLSKTSKTRSFMAIPAVEQRQYYPVSDAQRRLWFQCRRQGAAVAYNMPSGFIIHGPMDVDALTRAMDTLWQRHESLRTVFVDIAGQPRQKILSRTEQLFRLEQSQAGSFDDIADREAHTPFDLSRGPLLRAHLIRLEEETHAVLLNIHHIIGDALSMQVILRELTEFYLSYRSGQDPEPEPLAIQYKDFSIWRRHWLDSEAVKPQQDYWRQQLAGPPPLPDLGGAPVTGTNHNEDKFAGDQILLSLEEGLTRNLLALAKERDTTLFNVMLTILYILLQRFTGADDIILGTPVSGREHAGLDGQVGFYVNTLPLRLKLEPRDTALDVLERVKRVTLEAHENQSYPFDYMVRDLGMPIFNVMTDMVDAWPVQRLIEESREKGLDISPLPVQLKRAKFDLTLRFVRAGENSENRERLDIYFEYKTGLLDTSTVARWRGHFLAIAESIAASITEPVAGSSPQLLSETDLLLDHEKEELLYRFSGKAVRSDYIRDKTISDIFRSRAQARPDSIALLEPHLSFGDLDNRSDLLAYFLVSRGVRAGDIVALMLEPSPLMIISILAVLKAGAAYLPMDPSFPAPRIRYMLEDSACRLVVDQALLDDVDPGGAGREYPDLEYPGVSGDACYVIYTSGTTGKPKGVLVEHRNIVSLLFPRRPLFDFNEGDVWTLFHSYCFDFSVWEIFAPLSTGGKLLILPAGTARDTGAFAGLVERHGVTVLNQTPSAFYYFTDHVLNPDRPAARFALRYVIFGGEALNPAKLKAWNEHYPQVRLINMYGITETTVHVTYKEISSRDIWSRASTIGRPLPTLEIYILDTYCRPVPIGAPGELYVTGDGVSRGYINKPELTAERFVNSNFQKTNYKSDEQSIPPLISPLERGGPRSGGVCRNVNRRSSILYRTGDLARWLPGGDIQYLGRADRQVQLRGYRVEPAEIENHLLTHHSVKEAAVLARRDSGGETLLCAYVVWEKEEIENSGGELKEYLREKIPGYMIPAYFFFIDGMPLTPNGKLDHSALPLPGAPSKESFTAPRDHLETQLLEIFQEVLEVKDLALGIEADFFQLGGHSLKAALLASRIAGTLNVEVPLEVIFNTPTVRQLAEYISGAQERELVPIQPLEKREYYDLSPAQKRLFILHQMDTHNTPGVSYNIPSVRLLQGQINISLIRAAFQRLVRRHESLRTSFITVNGIPRQRIHETVDFQMETLEEFHGDESIKSFIRPFDLAQPPLFRLAWFSRASDSHVLMMDMHHIISDHVSQAILARELDLILNNRELPPLTLQYKDYAYRLNLPGVRRRLLQKEKYWLDRMSGELPLLDLPLDFPRPPVKNTHGGAVRFSAECPVQSNSGQPNSGLTPFMMLLAAFSILLARLSGQQEVIIGIPVAGRTHPGLEGLTGMFVNTLPARLSPRADLTLAEFFSRVKQTSLSLLENQEYPFEQLVEQLTLPRDPARHPLYDVVFNMLGPGDFPGTGADFDTIHGAAKFDLSLVALESAPGREMTFYLEYAAALFNEETIRDYSRYFKRILGQMHREQLCIGELDIITPEQRRRLQELFNGGHSAMPDTTLSQLIDQQAARTPDAIALVGNDRAFNRTYRTYEKTRQKSSELAALLRRRGFGPGDIVAVRLEDSVETVTALLAILQAGAAYLPIDAGYPPERVQYMLEDSAAALFIDGELPRCDGQSLEPVCAARPSDPAYVIYTSGTSGRPKGVAVRHRAVVNTLISRKQIYGMTDSDVSLQLFSYAFDGFVTSFFTPLISGSRSILMNAEEVLDISSITNNILKQCVTHFIAVPPLFRTIISSLTPSESPSQSAAIKTVTLAGDRLSPDLMETVRRFHPHIEIVHEYGVTEAAVMSTINPGQQAQTLISIGKPIPNTAVQILNSQGMLQPPGIPGELSITGQGLAIGYLNKPELTYKKFLGVQNPFYKKGFGPRRERLYHTGDLACWHIDGTLEFLGRIDRQVKIRGFRVELAEIENLLSAHESISQAAVTLSGGADASIIAFFVSSSSKVADTAILRRYLSRFLPPAMIPLHIRPLDRIPLSVNGKVDYRALSAYATPKPGEHAAFAAPDTHLEKLVATAWQDLLDVEKVGLKDNFFQLGGNSLKVMELNHRLNRELDTRIPVIEFFKYQTISSFVDYIKQHSGQHTTQPSVQLRQEQRGQLLDRGMKTRDARMARRRRK